jgi:cold shock CspA family protein
MVPGPVPSAGPHHGRVASFDATRGLGTVLADDDTTFPFHGTAVADGSRTIATGTDVTFNVVPGHGGLYEVRSLAPDSHQRPA